MKNKSSSVDVLIAAFNNADTIERAVRSAVSDDCVNRVIIVDDGSTDETPSVLAALKADLGDRLVCERLDANAGPSVARNRGIQLSTAPWIAILDADDYFLPNRIARLLDTSGDADFVADDQVQVREGIDDPVLHGELLVGHQTIIALDLATFVARNLSRKNRQRKELGFLKPIIRRSFLDLNQLRYDESLRLGEDFILYVRALAAGAIFVVVPSATYVSIVRPNSISGSHSKRDLEQLRDSSEAFARSAKLTIAERKLIRCHYASIDSRVQWLNVIDAVKTRNVKGFLSPFLIRWTTAGFLMGRLWEQIVARSKRSLGAS